MTALATVLPADEPYSPATGGAVATVADAIVRAALARGLDAVVVSPALNAAPYGAGVVREIPARPLPVRAVRRAWRAVRPGDAYADYRRRAAAATRAEAVIVHNDARLAERLQRAGHRVALWVHNLLPAAEGEALRSAHRAGATVVCVSRYVRGWIAAAYDLPVADILVVHNTVDAKVFTPPATWSPRRRLRVVMHGRIDPNKGQLLAARAVAAARADGVPVDLTVVGGPRTFGMPAGQTDRYLTELDAAMTLADARRVGRVEHSAVPALLREADVAVALPTVPEPFSLAALEALACGCATIAVPVGGLAEVVGDAALLCDPDPAAVAAWLTVLAADPRMLLRRREQARRRAEEFAWPGGLGSVCDLLL